MGDSTKKPPSGNERFKKIRRVHPLGMRVLVRLEEEPGVTDGGLYIPETAKDNMAESVLAQVIEVASAMDDHTHEETNISGIPFGSTVLINKTAGTKVPWDDRIRIIDSKDVLGIVHEVSLS
jgi:co-chaperonin GroES (HSP10)